MLLRGRKEEIALIAGRIDRPVQLGTGRPHHAAHIMAGREAIGAQIARELEKIGEFHTHVAADARDRRPAREIFVGELVDHRIAKAAFMVVDIMGEAKPVGDRARIAYILPRAASADALSLGTMVVELQRHADHLSARPRSERGDDARVDSARHCDHDSPIL